MERAPVQAKSSHQSAVASRSEGASAGSRGVALAPPGYGVDFVDRAPGDGSLPAGLRAGIEALSGFDMSDVRVHRGSSRPAELQARAFTQGTEIYLGPDQEQYLPHEAWHVVQQKQGRVRATLQAKGGLAVNDDAVLEREADVRGAEAASHAGGWALPSHLAAGPMGPTPVVQCGGGKEKKEEDQQPSRLGAMGSAFLGLVGEGVNVLSVIPNYLGPLAGGFVAVGTGTTLVGLGLKQLLTADADDELERSLASLNMIAGGASIVSGGAKVANYFTGDALGPWVSPAADLVSALAWSFAEGGNAGRALAEVHDPNSTERTRATTHGAASTVKSVAALMSSPLPLYQTWQGPESLSAWTNIALMGGAAVSGIAHAVEAGYLNYSSYGATAGEMLPLIPNDDGSSGDFVIMMNDMGSGRPADPDLDGYRSSETGSGSDGDFPPSGGIRIRVDSTDTSSDTDSESEVGPPQIRIVPRCNPRSIGGEQGLGASLAPILWMEATAAERAPLNSRNRPNYGTFPRRFM